jgi:hypothetical protein
MWRGLVGFRATAEVRKVEDGGMGEMRGYGECDCKGCEGLIMLYTPLLKAFCFWAARPLFRRPQSCLEAAPSVLHHALGIHLLDSSSSSPHAIIDHFDALPLSVLSSRCPADYGPVPNHCPNSSDYLSSQHRSPPASPAATQSTAMH